MKTAKYSVEVGSTDKAVTDTKVRLDNHGNSIGTEKFDTDSTPEIVDPSSYGNSDHEPRIIAAWESYM